MARTSSWSLNNTEAVVSSVQENTAQENETVTKLHTAAYCRLSVENRGRKDEGTIETQVKMEKVIGLVPQWSSSQSFFRSPSRIIRWFLLPRKASEISFSASINGPSISTSAYCRSSELLFLSSRYPV